MQWSQYQTDIFEEAARDTTDNVAVVARAGCGKTTSLIEALKHVPYRRVLLCAFNKSIQTEMERRAPANVLTRTLHSLGLRIHQTNLRGGRADVTPDKAKEQSRDLLRQNDRYLPLTRGIGFDGRVDPNRRLYEAAGRVRRLVSYAKNVLVDQEEDLVRLVGQLDLDEDDFDPNLLVHAGQSLMERAAEDRYHVDFDDMVWFPYRFGYGVEPGTEMLRFDAVMVDEAQDLNPAQLWMVGKMRYNGRVIGFLDDRQCIYAFRGADRDAISQIIGDPRAKRLPLSISYRCPVSVVEKARLVVPDIEPASDAREGTVRLDEYGDMLDEAAPGDFILSRTNAPLMATCLALLKRDKPATVAGRDIGQSLMKLINKSKATTINELHEWLAQWLAEQHDKYMPDAEERFARAVDRVEGLRAVASHCMSVSDVRSKLDQLFSDDVPEHKIVCSTVHKAKGLERDTVWMLHDTFGYPDPKRWQDSWSEENIWYVAVTRSRDTLRFVETEMQRIVKPKPRTRRRI